MSEETKNIFKKIGKKGKLSILFSLIVLLIIISLVIFLPNMFIFITPLIAAILGVITSVIANFVFDKFFNSNTKRFREMKTNIMNNNDDKINVILDKYTIDTKTGNLIIRKSNPSVVIEDIDKIDGEKDNPDIKLENDVKDALIKQTGQKDILELMFDNMKEIRDYFSISKNHAKLSFWLAILNCLVGIGLLCLSVYYALTNQNMNPSIIAAVAGAVSELFAGTSLVVHKKSLLQLNHYYNALHDNEMFLSTLNLVGNVSIEKQDDLYIDIIKNELNVRYSKATGKIIEDPEK